MENKEIFNLKLIMRWLSLYLSKYLYKFFIRIAKLQPRIPLLWTYRQTNVTRYRRILRIMTGTGMNLSPATPLALPRTWSTPTRLAPSLWFLKLKGNTNAPTVSRLRASWILVTSRCGGQNRMSPLILGTIRRGRAFFLSFIFLSKHIISIQSEIFCI